MKKLIVKIIVFFGIVVLIDQCVGAVFVAMKEYGLRRHPQCVWLRPQYVMEKVSDDVLFFGSSRTSRGIVSSMVQDSLGVTAYNCGQEGCMFLYQNCLINTIIDRYSPKCVVWEINPRTIVEDFSPSEYQNFRHFSPYYDDNIYVRNYVDSAAEMNKLFMCSQMYRYNSKLFYYLFPIISSADNTENGYAPLPATGYKYPQMIKLKDNKRKGTHNFSTRKYDMLTATIRRCVDKNIFVVLITIPTYSEVSPETMKNIRDLQRLSEKPLVSFHNYVNDRRFMHADLYYKGAVHLNSKGAELFTKILIEECLTPILESSPSQNKILIESSICDNVYTR